ncbi:DUF222 domain-containing protein [Intrasporangium sp. DVR]|uniref:HNH endonuclease n=1 Tax=Intrasporangium sp. DVR TaxID=3127867 RepID=UPI00313A5357
MDRGLGLVAEPAGVGSGSMPGGLSAKDLEEWAAALAGLDGADLGAAELVDLLATLERAKASCAAAQAKVTAAFVAAEAHVADHWRHRAQECLDASDFEGYCAAKDSIRRHEFAPVPLNGRPHERESSRGSRRGAHEKAGIAAQVGLARHESPHRGARLATTAVALVEDLPHTLEALTTGQLNERRAELVARLTSHLSRDQRLAVDAEAVGANLADPAADVPAGIATWGDRRLEATVRAVADRIDAEAAVARARTAESERRVTLRPIPDTMAVVTAVLPVAQAVALYAALTAAAATAQAGGDPRGKGQVMADTLVDRVLCSAVGSGADEAGPALPSLPPDIPVEVQVVITDRALLEGDETPAHIPGYGPVPAGWARELLTRDLGPPPADASGGSPPARARRWLRRLYTHPATGNLVALDSKRRLFPAGLRRFLIARDGVCRTPWCDAPIRHADHVEPWAGGGSTSAGNGQGLCVRCNHVKEQPGWRHRVDRGVAGPGLHEVVLTTPTGHHHTSVAPPVLPGQRNLVSGETASPLEAWLIDRLAG